MTPDEQAVWVEELTRRCGEVLHGHGPVIQGAVLADLLAMWLAGHVGSGAAEMREHLLTAHIEAVRSLIECNEAMVLDRAPPKGSA